PKAPGAGTRGERPRGGYPAEQRAGGRAPRRRRRQEREPEASARAAGIPPSSEPGAEHPGAEGARSGKLEREAGDEFPTWWSGIPYWPGLAEGACSCPTISSQHTGEPWSTSSSTMSTPRS